MKNWASREKLKATDLNANFAELSAAATAAQAAASEAISLTAALSALGPGLLSGSDTPLDAVGADGQFYMDLLNGRIFGPKASGVWPPGYFDLGVRVIPSADTLPNPFSFTPIVDAPLNTLFQTAWTQITGINTASPISITGGTYSINTDPFTSLPGWVSDGDLVGVRITSSSANATAVAAVLNVGGVTAAFTVTTAVATDTTPDAFVFTDVSGATPATQYTSNAITVAGINASTAISISGGTYSKNGAAYTSAPGTANNGDTVSVRITASASDLTAVNAVLTIGGVSDTFTVTTAPSGGSGGALDFTAPSNSYFLVIV